MTTQAQGGVPAIRGYLDEGGRSGILAWILSTDHKRIGVLYLASMVSLFFVAMAIGVLMRIEQLRLDPPFFTPQTYNAFFTVHGVIMIFMFVLPGLSAAFGNFMLPLLIGARATWPWRSGSPRPFRLSLPRSKVRAIGSGAA